jgi:hypothetical protein
MIDHIMSDPIVIPAQAGIQALFLLRQKSLDSRFHACVPKRLYCGVQAWE